MIAIETIVVTPFEQNARIVTNTELNRTLIIDPGGDVDRLLQKAPELEAILLTHSHIDHCGGVAKILRICEERGMKRPRLYAGAESALRQNIVMQAAYFGLGADEFENCPEPDELLEPGQSIQVIGLNFEPRFTPGHAPGHFSFVLENVQFSITAPREKISGTGTVVFAGDALFSGSIGRTDLPGGDHNQLIDSIRAELMTLDDDTLVLSGHGPMTTIGKERRTNPFLLAQ